MEIITLVIAIIGAITGIASLIIQYVDYKKSKVKLRVNLDERKSFYNTGDKLYKCDFFGVLSLKISNCSSLPITIDEAEIKHNGIKRIYINEKKQINNSHKYDDNRFTEISLYEQPQLPLRIDCYDTVFLSFVFPFFDEFIDKEFEFVIKTPRKDYKYTFKIKDFESIFNK